MTSLGMVCRVLLEFALYDLMNACFGFAGIRDHLMRKCRTSGRPPMVSPTAVYRAVNLAACFYIKPVRCLQRSVATVRLLRKCGVASRLVIAYRPSPFLAHAWVEVAGNIVNDSPEYPKQLRVLCKL